jgi:hypothetical protein
LYRISPNPNLGVEKVKRTLRKCLVLLAYAGFVFTIAGCSVYSTQPIVEETKAQPDIHLLGTWKELRDGALGSQSFTISRDPKNQNLLLFACDDATRPEPPREGKLFCTTIGNHNYASVCEAGQIGDQRYLQCRYEIREGRFLGIWGPDVKFFEHAVENKELKATIVAPGRILELHSSTRELRKFIEKNEPKCFTGEDSTEHPTVYYRIEDEK